MLSGQNASLARVELSALSLPACCADLQLSGHFVKVVARTELYHLLLTVESNFLSYAWPLRQAAFECLGSFGCNLAMLELPAGSDRADAEKSTLDRGIEVIVTSLQELDCCSAINLR
jgi:hypothetical protein